VQHDAGFDCAAVNAVLQFLRVKQVAHLRHIEPGAIHGEHIETDAQLPAHDIDQLRLPPVGIEEDDLATAAAVHALGQIEP